MDFTKVIEEVGGAFDREGIRYALIGGFAMALRGVQRATVDMDFVLLLDDLPRADAILLGAGYERVFRSENVSHYQNPAEELGRIDILHAFREASVGMLARADRLAIASGRSLPVVRIEDLVGLKIQAAVNDPARATADWADIESLIRSAAEQRVAIDWDRIGDFLALFDLGRRLGEMKLWHEPADQGGD